MQNKKWLKVRAVLSSTKQLYIRYLPGPLQPFWGYCIATSVVLLVGGVVWADVALTSHKVSPPSSPSSPASQSTTSTNPTPSTNSKTTQPKKKSTASSTPSSKSTTPAKSSSSSTSTSGSTTQKSSSTTSSVKPTIVGHTLELGSTGTRLKMRGVAVWGIEDQITGSFGVSEYNNRQTIINTVKAWGGNEIRLRVLASDYNSQTYMTKQQELQEIKNWQQAAQAAGLYMGITWWDSLDGPYSNANWATQYTQAFPMMNDVVKTLGATNQWVFYEPFNEPNNVSSAQWLSAMESTVHNFRADGYTGILLIDTDGWSHEYDNSLMTSLEQYDAGQSGMGGKNQIIFGKHDYANEYPSYASGFTSSYWPNNNNGTSTWSFSAHLVWETEFGNYNGGPSSVSYPWSLGAASWMAAKVNDGTLAGASAFVFGPWYDANAMTSSDDTTPTQWGGYVKNDFLGGI